MVGILCLGMTLHHSVFIFYATKNENIPKLYFWIYGILLAKFFNEKEYRISLFFINTETEVYTLSRRIGSALAWHSEGRVFESHWLQQDMICCPYLHYASWAQDVLPCEGWGGGNGQSIGSTVSDAIVWLWSTANGSSPFGYLVALLQVVENWPPRSVVADSPLGGSWP